MAAMILKDRRIEFPYSVCWMALDAIAADIASIRSSGLRAAAINSAARHASAATGI